MGKLFYNPPLAFISFQLHTHWKVQAPRGHQSGWIRDIQEEQVWLCFTLVLWKSVRGRGEKSGQLYHSRQGELDPLRVIKKKKRDVFRGREGQTALGSFKGKGSCCVVWGVVEEDSEHFLFFCFAQANWNVSTHTDHGSIFIENVFVSHSNQVQKEL